MKIRFCLLVFGLGLALCARTGAQTTVSLPGKGIAQHPFVYIGEGQNIIYVVRDGKVDWTWQISRGLGIELDDVHLLSSGNILISTKLGCYEITPKKDIAWFYIGPPGTETHVCQPIGLDKVMIVQNGRPCKMMVIEKAKNKIVMEHDLETSATGNVHGQVRRARILKNGHYLVGHLDRDKVIEYDKDWKEIWSYSIRNPWSVVRLDNGNTLIGGNQRGEVREVNPKGEIVWQITRNELPGIRLNIVQEVSRLANGDTLICNAGGSATNPNGQVQLIEVTPDKKVVWALRDWKSLGGCTAVQLLDEPGKAEDGDMQR